MDTDRVDLLQVILSWLAGSVLAKELSHRNQQLAFKTEIRGEIHDRNRDAYHCRYSRCLLWIKFISIRYAAVAALCYWLASCINLDNNNNNKVYA